MVYDSFPLLPYWWIYLYLRSINKEIIKNYIDVKVRVDTELIIIPLLMCLPTFVFTFAAGDMTSLWVLLFFFSTLWNIFDKTIL